ncbi:MAG: hypothetical protein ACFFD2_10055 [Promethearchaeota archaeon]
MNAIRILIGLLFSLAASILIVFFVTLGYNLSNYSSLGSTAIYQTIFAAVLSPLTSIKMGLWSVIAAIGVGAFIGGLLSKSPLGGLIVGLLSFATILVIFMIITIGFDFSAWITWVQTWDSSVIADIALCAGLFGGIAAIGGKLTSE